MYSDFIKYNNASICSTSIENLVLYTLANIPKNSTQNSIEMDLFSYTTHRHAYSELFVCEEGELHLKTKDGILILHAGEAVIMPPSFQHNKHFSSKNAIWGSVGFLCLRNNVNCTHDIYTHFSDFLNPSTPYFIRNKLDFCRNVVYILHHLSDLSPWLTAISLFQQLAFYALPRKNMQIHSNALQLPDAVDCDISRHCKLDHIINVCFMHDFTTTDIANVLHISSRQLSRFVLKHYGTTLYQAITNKRIVTAEQMLIKTDLSIEKIALAVGFTTIASLYREFQKKHLMTPAQYREQYIKEK